MDVEPGDRRTAVTDDVRITTERELFRPVDLCDDRGRLAPEAIGWSRLPLHRCNLSGAHGRKKRWDYWCVMAPDLHIAVTYADVDYLGIAGIWLFQPSTGLELTIDRPLPFAPGFALPEAPGLGVMTASSRGLRLSIIEEHDATLLQARCDSTPHGRLDVDLVVERPEHHQSLNVVIPWSDHRFQFTTKDNTRQVTGTVRLGAQTFELGPDRGAFAALDVGRGIWKYSNRWNWASASGIGSSGELVGLQFGGKWTEGTGFTENALCVDGILHKIGDELEWTYEWDRPLEPWRVRDTVGDRVDVTLTPYHDRHSRVTIGILAMEVHQCFGTWSGRVVTDSGAEITFDGILGFAEEARNRW